MRIQLRESLESLREWVYSLFFNPNAVLLRRIQNQVEGIMATIADVQAELTSVNETVAAERLEVQSKLSDLAAQVKALQDQIAAGGGASAADLDSLLAAIQSLKGGIGQISEPTA